MKNWKTPTESYLLRWIDNYRVLLLVYLGMTFSTGMLILKVILNFIEMFPIFVGNFVHRYEEIRIHYLSVV
jgi:hypothetical protein